MGKSPGTHYDWWFKQGFPVDFLSFSVNLHETRPPVPFCAVVSVGSEDISQGVPQALASQQMLGNHEIRRMCFWNLRDPYDRFICSI